MLQDWTCVSNNVITCACQNPDQMYLQLRGLCPDSNIDQFYVPRNKKKSGAVELLGLMTTTIGYNKQSVSWTLYDHYKVSWYHETFENSYIQHVLEHKCCVRRSARVLCSGDPRVEDRGGQRAVQRQGGGLHCHSQAHRLQGGRVHLLRRAVHQDPQNHFYALCCSIHFNSYTLITYWLCAME